MLSPEVWSARPLSTPAPRSCPMAFVSRDADQVPQEVLQLSAQLSAAAHDRLVLEKNLTYAQRERERVEAASKARLDAQSELFEERISELHGVIAQLTRPVRREEGGGEDAASQSEAAERGGDLSESSTNRRPGDPRTNSITSCCTDNTTSADIDDRAVEAGEGIADLDVSDVRGPSDEDAPATPSEDECDDIVTDAPSAADNRQSTETRAEETRRLRSSNRRLQRALQELQRTKLLQQEALRSVTLERDEFKNQVQQLQQQQMQPAIRCSTQQVSDAVAVKGLLRTSQSSLYRACGSPSPVPPGDRPPGSVTDPPEGGGAGGVGSPGQDPLPENEDPPIICKMAERVRLKKTNTLGQVTGCDLRHLGVSSTAVAEQLIASLNEESQSQELFYALATAGGTLVPHERLKEYEVEVERLNAKLDHLKAQNDVLSITLNESKAHCDHLSILMGKYESNSSALQLTVSTLDMTVESLEVLVALLESELGLLLATYRASEGGSSRWKEGTHKDLFGAMKLSQEHRRATENVARHLLSRCERELSVTLPRVDHQSEGPATSDEISRTEEIRIRQLVNRLKDDRRNISASVVHLESLLTDPLTAHHPLPEEEALKLDLENSVLMQELTAVREDRAELRAQVYLLEREKAGLELRLGTCEARETALVATIDLLKAQAERTNNLLECCSTDSGAADCGSAVQQEDDTEKCDSREPVCGDDSGPSSSKTNSSKILNTATGFSSISGDGNIAHNKGVSEATASDSNVNSVQNSLDENPDSTSTSGATGIGLHENRSSKSQSLENDFKDSAKASKIASEVKNKDSGRSRAEILRVSSKTPSAYECQLRDRIQVLVSTLEKLTANSEARHRQSQQFIEDLKKANSALVGAVERLKKKYSVRLQRMEQQNEMLMERRSIEVHGLKQTILELEDQLAAYQDGGRPSTASPNETCL